VRGYVLKEKGKAVWEDIPVPQIGPYDALVRPTAVATCTTDVHAIATLAFRNMLDKVIGHEAVGIVDSVGELVKDFKPGDRVVLPAILADWRNPRAQRGEAKHYQANSVYISSNPDVGGAFSELVKAIDADMVLAHIPDAVTDIQAVMVDDMVATGFTGVENMEIKVGEVVVVLGIGPVGLMGVGSTHSAPAESNAAIVLGSLRRVSRPVLRAAVGVHHECLPHSVGLARPTLASTPEVRVLRRRGMCRCPARHKAETAPEGAISRCSRR
jgi:threonine dehydrogenase-like Zn-dependent dehydrogenase